MLQRLFFRTRDEISLNLIIKHQTVKTYWSGGIAPQFLNSATDGVECSSPQSYRVTAVETVPGVV
jgi:hypothetical protein